MPKLLLKMYKKIKKWYDKIIKNSITYQINKENNKFNQEEAKKFDERGINLLEKVFGPDLIKQDSKAYTRKKLTYRNDSNERKLEFELETKEEKIILKSDDKLINIDTIEIKNKQKQIANNETTENEKQKTNRNENEENEINFYKETRETKK